jgi:hypothetical protein
MQRPINEHGRLFLAGSIQFSGGAIDAASSGTFPTAAQPWTSKAGSEFQMRSICFVKGQETTATLQSVWRTEKRIGVEFTTDP